MDEEMMEIKKLYKEGNKDLAMQKLNERWKKRKKELEAQSLIGEQIDFTKSLEEF